MAVGVTFSLQGLLAPGQLGPWEKRLKESVLRAMRDGMRDARPQTDRIMQGETARAFKVKPGSKMQRSWRGRVIDEKTDNPKLQITNLARWFKIHTTGGTITPKSAPRAVLIPINTRLGARIGTKKFYKLIDWLMQEKLTFIKNGILYVKPVMNTSRRGGVAAGSRVNKRFRTRFQGSQRRPSGFEIKLNEHGLTPIAIIRSSITMKRRMDLNALTRAKLLPVVSRAVQNRLVSRDLRV